MSCFISLTAQSNIDSLLILIKKEDKADSIVKVCWRKHGGNKYVQQFQDCIDTGLLYYPEYAGLIRLKGMPYLKLGDYQSAYYYFNKATSLNHKEYHYVAYVSIYHLRDYRRGLSELLKFDKLTPNYPDVVMGDNILYLYGLCYQQLNSLDSANVFLDSLISISNQNKMENLSHLAFLLRAIVRHKQRLFKLSQLDILSALKINKNCVECNYYMAKNQIEMKEDKQKIIMSIKKAEELYLQGYKNKDPYGEYIELPNAIYLSDIKNLFEEIKY